MKLKIYLDVSRWTDQGHFFPANDPRNLGDKAKDAKRYRVEFEVADPGQVDETVQGKAVEI